MLLSLTTRSLLLVVTLNLVTATQAILPSASPPQVKIANGTVVGLYNKPFKQDFFLGVPYAQPPLGDLRFRPPQYISKPLKTIDARKYGKHCYGYGADQVGFEISEDCLTLNIIRPAGVHTHSKLPVAVWIHGGGLYQGGAPDPRYNLSFLVDQSVKLGAPIIGVSLNYRLSAWGFMSGREAQGTGNTNIGFKDQRLALHWVQENIKAFGGDPKKVTIFGESAGAWSVGYQLTAYGGRDDGLFRAAIMQSGAPVNYVKLMTPESTQPLVDGLMDAFGCTDAPDKLQCLRGVDARALDQALNGTDPTLGIPRAFAFQAVLDGDFIKEYGSQSLKKGKYVKVPTIIGGTSDEGTSGFSFLVPGATESTEGIANWLGFLTYLSRNLIGRVLSLYNESVSIPEKERLVGVVTPPQLGAMFHRMAAISGDIAVDSNKRYTAEVLTAQKVPVWTFRFKAVPNGSPPFIGASHFSEVAFVLNNVNGNGYATNPLGGSKAAEYKKLADLMSKSWIRFIVSGDPNKGPGKGKDEVYWPVYGNGAKQMSFDIGKDGVSVETDDYRKEGISFLNKNALQIGR